MSGLHPLLKDFLHLIPPGFSALPRPIFSASLKSQLRYFTSCITVSDSWNHLEKEEIATTEGKRRVEHGMERNLKILEVLLQELVPMIRHRGPDDL